MSLRPRKKMFQVMGIECTDLCYNNNNHNNNNNSYHLSGCPILLVKSKAIIIVINYNKEFEAITKKTMTIFCLICHAWQFTLYKT